MSDPTPVGGDRLEHRSQVADERTRDLAAVYADVAPEPLPMAPDGGVVPLTGASLAIPPATPETYICLRGPCRHYWQLETLMDVGNADGTFGPGGLIDPATGRHYEQPRQVHRTCTAAPGVDTDLTEATVVACSRHEPIDIKKGNAL